MPTTDENISLWANYAWPNRGEEWSVAWGGSQSQWLRAIRPRVAPFLPAETILEIGTGFGRWTHYLKSECENLIGVDLSEKCIEHCRERFSEDPRVNFHINDGNSLAMIEDGSIDLVFSFDSLVHCQTDVLEAYLSQLATKLKPNGVGFIHHSNLASYRTYYSVKRMIPRGKGLLWRLGILDNDGLRASDVSAASFELLAQKSGLQCISQELVNWGSRRLIDCFSIFTRHDSIWSRANVVIENPGFMKEAEQIRELSAATVRSSLR